MELRTARRALGIVVLVSPSLHAANFTWDGGATAGSEWSRGNNWVGNAAPPSDGTADLFFDGSVRLTPDADADWSIRALTFNSGAGGFDIGGDTLTIGAGGVTSNDDNSQTIQNDVLLASPQTFDTTDGWVTFEGRVDLNGNALTLAPADNHRLYFRGRVFGSGGITKNDTGDVHLACAAANTFGGTLTVNDGSVFLQAPAAGITMVPGALTIQDGSVSFASVSVLDVNEQIANTSAVTVNGGHFRVNGVVETIASLTLNGGVAFAEAGGTLVVSGLAMTAGFVSAGGTTGTLVLNGNVTTAAEPNIATIGVTVLDLNNGTRTFTVGDGTAPGVDLQITSQLLNGSITKEGPGQMRLAGTPANGATNTRVNAGLLELKTLGGNAVSGALFVGDGSALGASVRLLTDRQIADFGTVVVNANSELDIGPFSETIGNLTLNGGTVDGSGGTLTVNDNVAAGGTATSTISCPLNLGGVSRNFIVAETGAADDLRVSGPVSEGALVKQGAGTLVLTGANTYTGGTLVQAGTLRVSRLHANNAVTILSGAKVQVMDSAPTLPAHPSGDNAFVSRPSGLTIASNGSPLGSRVYNAQLDLTNNDLILDYSGASPIASIEDMVRAGYNGGDWLGNGITSSTANADRNFALAVADNSRLTIQFDGTRLFSGQVVDATTILVKFTHRIDLDLDGVVTTNDATIFNSNYVEGAPAYWSIGDLDYDRLFTTNDATLFNSFYNEALASVPEPAAGVVVLAGALLARRRVR